MIIRFSSGSVTPASASRKRSSALTWIRSTAKWERKVSLDLFRLAEPEQPVVDEDAGELVADRRVDEGGGHRRVDSAGKTADHLSPTDLRLDRGDL